MQHITFDEKLAGAIAGAAIGDGMGAPVEGRTHTSIWEEYHSWDFTRFLPRADGDTTNPLGKGNGRITDDTLMTEALIETYISTQSHLDSYDYTTHLLPRIVNTPVWLPERQQDMPIFDRLWHPEKYPYWRFIANAEPRSAGIGNSCNCGIAMWIMPVGAVNAGDPEAAYHEAVSLSLAHNQSFAIEAAAVLAAAYARAFSPDATIAAITSDALALARDGTRHACQAALDAVHPSQTLPEFVHRVRTAVAPFDQRQEHESDDASPMHSTSPVNDIGHPSRTKSIEELPAALAALIYGQGDFLKTLQASVCYGRDCDSIASMACGLHGALHGTSSLPRSLTISLDTANRRDFSTLARRFAHTIRAIHTRDLARAEAHSLALSRKKPEPALVSGPSHCSKQP